MLTKRIICVNDSKATSFEATSQSLKNYSNIFWILGGLKKMKDRFSLNRYKNNIIKAYIVGNDVNFFKKQLRGKINFSVTRSLKKTVQKVIKDIKQKQKNNNFLENKYTILLSPAAASFDQFKNFEERGNIFKKLIYKNRSSIK